MIRPLVASLVLSIAVAGLGAELGELAELTLTDQNGAEDRLVDHAGAPVVVTVVTAKRLRNVRPWERDLQDRFPELDTIRIADVPDDSPATFEQVAAKLRERVPEGVSVLIDVDRRWATALGLDTSRPNILLVNADGVLVASHHGRHTPELAAEVLDDIERLLGGS